MRFVYGLIGAIVGALTGGALAVFGSNVVYPRNDWDSAWAVVLFAPIGLAVGAVAGIILSETGVWNQTRQARTCNHATKRIWVIACWCAAPILIAFGMAAWSFRLQYPPSDAAMIANFNRNRGTFDRLASMAKANSGLERVDEDWTCPADPQTVRVSKARIDEYRRLLRGSQVPRGFERCTSTNEIDFYYWLRGSAITDDSEKSYAFCMSTPAHIVDSLDSLPSAHGDEIALYRHITGNWYLLYEYIPD